MLGVCPDGFSLPCQHSLVHYEALIRLFGAPNGLCMSITVSKHIKAVKEPWRHSSKFKALGQMLLMNQHLDKLQQQQLILKSVECSRFRSHQVTSSIYVTLTCH